MSWLAFLFSLSLGVLPLGVFPTWEDQICTAESILAGSLFTDFNFRVYAWDLIYIGGGVKTFMFPPQELWTKASFDPCQAQYKFEAGFEVPINRHTMFNLHWIHFCIHPIITFMPTHRVRNLWEGAYEELSVGIEVDTRERKR